MSNEITREDLVAGMERGERIKRKAKTFGIPLWWCAKAFGVNDGNFSRLLRDLPEEDYKKLDRIIERLSVGR